MIKSRETLTLALNDDRTSWHSSFQIFCQRINYSFIGRLSSEGRMSPMSCNCEGAGLEGRR